MREFEIQEQPFLFTIETIPYNELRQVYEGWDRWEYVPRNLVRMITENTSDEIYRTELTSEEMIDKVEVVKYQDKPNNEYQIFLNGVMMLPAGFPLSAISPSGEYTIAKGDISPISKFFAYSKSIPAKTKVDQEVLDEFMRLIILKTQQSFMPPMANNTNKVLSNRVFFPGRITKNINPDQLKPVVDARGVSQSEFNAFEFIKGIVDQKSVSPTFAGEASSSRQTATEILELKKQQMMKLGLAIWGVMKLEKQLSWLVMQGVIAHWTKPIDTRMDEVTGQVKDIYMSVSVDGEIGNGQKGRKIIDFNEEMADTITQDQVDRQAAFMSKGGRPTSIAYINPKVLRSVYYSYYITITPTEKDSSELQRMLFVQNLSDAMQLFPNRINMPYAEQRFATLIGEDPAKFFTAMQPQMAEGMGMPGQNPGMPEAQAALAGQAPIGPKTADRVGGEIGAQVQEGAKGLKNLMKA